MTPVKPQLLPLTGIRLFLALWVVHYHLPILRPGKSAFEPPAWIFVIHHNADAVLGIFFILSGFVLSYNYTLDQRWSKESLTRFAIARFARIYPAYFLGLVLMVPIMINLAIQNFSYEKIAKDATMGALNLLLLQSWLPKTALTWNYPGWSTATEAFFYCCFPFMGIALWKIRRPWPLFWAGLIIWVAALAAPETAIALSLNRRPFWIPLLLCNPILRFPDFCLGIIAGRVYRRLLDCDSSLIGRGAWLYGPASVLLILALVACGRWPHLAADKELLLPLDMLLVLGLALGGGPLARFLSLPFIVFMGNVSFTIYILHVPVAQLTGLIARSLFHYRMGFTTLYVAVVCIATVVYKFAEEPATRKIRRRLNQWSDARFRKR